MRATTFDQAAVSVKATPQSLPSPGHLDAGKVKGRPVDPGRLFPCQPIGCAQKKQTPRGGGRALRFYRNRHVTTRHQTTSSARCGVSPPVSWEKPEAAAISNADRRGLVTPRRPSGEKPTRDGSQACKPKSDLFEIGSQEGIC